MERLFVLVVEDDPDCASVLQEALTLGGHEAEVAATSPEALIRVARRRPDLAIVDGRLAGADGLDLVRSLRRGALPEAPILLATGCSKAEVAVAARAAGVDAVLVKPIELSTLLSTVAALASRRRGREAG